MLTQEEQKMHFPFIDRCIELAFAARDKGNHPFGALLVYEDKILLEAENQVNSLNDPTEHAELRLIKNAFAQIDPSIIKKCTLYTSTEPCAMCSGAIYWSGINKLVFGISASNLGSLTDGSLVIACEEIFQKGKRKIGVVGPIKPKECERVHHHFWK